MVARRLYTRHYQFVAGSTRSKGDLKVQELADTYSIRNWSLWLDVYILLRTLDMLLTPKGAH